MVVGLKLDNTFHGRPYTFANTTKCTLAMTRNGLDVTPTKSVRCNSLLDFDRSNQTQPTASLFADVN